MNSTYTPEDIATLNADLPAGIALRLIDDSETVVATKGLLFEDRDGVTRYLEAELYLDDQGEPQMLLHEDSNGAIYIPAILGTATDGDELEQLAHGLRSELDIFADWATGPATASLRRQLARARRDLDVAGITDLTDGDAVTALGIVADVDATDEPDFVGVEDGHLVAYATIPTCFDEEDVFQWEPVRMVEGGDLERL